VISGGVALAIIAVRAVTLMGFWLAISGIVLPAAAIMTITLLAAIWPSLQGILLTTEALGFFIAAMMLIPKIPVSAIVPTNVGLTPPPAPA